MPIDLVRFRDWMSRAQQASEQAMQRGDLGAAKALGKLLEQADKALPMAISQHQPITAGGGNSNGFYNYLEPQDYQQPQAQKTPQSAQPAMSGTQMSGDPLAALMAPPSARQGKPITDPVAEHRALVNDPNTKWAGASQPIQETAKQETSPSFFDRLFSGQQGGYGAGAQVFGSAPPPKQSNVQPVGQGFMDTTGEELAAKVGNVKPSDIGKAVAAQKDNAIEMALGPVLTRVPKLVGNIAADKPLRNWLDDVEKPNPNATRPIGASENEHLMSSQDEPVAASQSPEPAQAKPNNADPYTDADKSLVDNSGLENFSGGKSDAKKDGQWGVADYLGLLLGGRNFLHYKQGQERRQEERDWQDTRDQRHREESRNELNQTLSMREKALAIEYAKALAAQNDKASQRESAEYNNVIRAFAQPGANTSDPLLKEAGNRARAIQLKRNQN